MNMKKAAALLLSLALAAGIVSAAAPRAKAADAGSSVLEGEQRNRAVPEGGQLSLLVARDDLMGSAVLLILTDAAGRVVFKHALTIGDL